MDNLKEYLKMESILVAGACDTTSASIIFQSTNDIYVSKYMIINVFLPQNFLSSELWEKERGGLI